MNATTPEEIYTQIVKAFNDENYRLIAELFADDALLVPPHHQTPVNAKKALQEKEFVFRSHSLYTLKITVDQVVRVGTTARVFYNWIAEGNMGNYEFSGVDIVREASVENWLIVLNDAFQNTAGSPVLDVDEVQTLRKTTED